MLQTNQFLLADEPFASSSKTQKRDKHSLRGFGWIKTIIKGEETVEWSYTLAKKHKELIDFLEQEQNTTNNDNDNSKDNNVILDYPTASPATQCLSEAEILEWVIEHPEEAVEYLIRGGYTGGRLTILAWLNKNIDEATTLIYNKARYGTFTKPSNIDSLNVA